jgi:hypothetical protein
MKKLFYFFLLTFLAFEVANVYFIMPMPKSQELNSLDFAYFIYSWRWIFRVVLVFLIGYSFYKASWKRKWIPVLSILPILVIAYLINFNMAADQLFKQPKTIQYQQIPLNKVDENRLVIGVEINGVAKAYPIEYLAYHHFIYDTIKGKTILVTYCSVCRTGRVFEPIVRGKIERFRLVGMSHYNAMIEDETTKSWWQQATGEAISGELKGEKLKEVFSSQSSLKVWLTLHPNSYILQADRTNKSNYSSSFAYEDGTSKSSLTGTNSESWKAKSWVIGVKSKDGSHTFDWNELKEKRVIHSKIGSVNSFLLLSQDNKSFFAFENPINLHAQLVNDTIKLGKNLYRLNGHSINSLKDLKPLIAYQEFWHSWKQFSKNK